MMLVRIVQLTIKEDCTDEFISIFSASKENIRGFEGCQQLSLLQETEATNVFKTYSIWENEAALEDYRNSELFISTWKKVKPLFKEKAQAWSHDRLFLVE